MEHKRPHITCLMMTSIDGKILGDTWGNTPSVQKLTDKYEQVHDRIGIKTWIVGRGTMEKDFTKGAKPIYKVSTRTIDRSDYIADAKAESYAIAIDAHAKLGWESATMQGEQVITVLTEAVPNAYLAHLQDIGVSYIFAGKEELNLSTAVEKLYSLFGIRELMLEGGGTLNGSFLDAGLVDEIYQILLPIVDGGKDVTTFFDKDEKDKKFSSTLLSIKSIEHLEDEALLLRYHVREQIQKK